MKRTFFILTFILFCFNAFTQKKAFKEKYICYWDETTVFELNLKFKEGNLRKADMTTNRNFKVNLRAFTDKDSIKGIMTLSKHDKEYLFRGWLVDSNFLMCETIDSKTGKVFMMLPFFSGNLQETATESYKEFTSGKVPKFDEKLVGKWVSKGYFESEKIKSLDELKPVEKPIKIEFKATGGTKSENFWITKDAKFQGNGLIYRIGENKIYYRLNTMEDQIVIYSYLFYALSDNFLIITKDNHLYYFTKDEN